MWTKKFYIIGSPIISTESEWPDGIFCRVVVGFETPVFEVSLQGLSLVQGIVDSLLEGLRANGCCKIPLMTGAA